MSPLATALCKPLTRPLTSAVTEGVGGAAWASALPALRTFVTANYNQPNPHNQAVMASPPTITTGAGTSGAPPSPYAALTTAYTHPAGTVADVMRMEGGGSVTFSTDYRRFPVSTVGASGGNVDTTHNATEWRATAIVNASAVAFSVLGGSATLPYRFIVDGKYVSTAGTIVSTGGRQYIVLDFGSKAIRTITIESEVSQALRGIHVASGDTVTKPPSPLRMIVLGDSFTEGTGTGNTSGDAFTVVAGEQLGASDVWSSGVGGTGYVNDVSGTKYKLSQRLSDANSYGPWNIIVVAMGINDVGLTAATITSEVTTCLSSLRSNNPRAQILVVGPWDVNAPSAVAGGYATTKAAIQAGIPTGAGFTFLDPQGVSYTKFDSTHPDTAGHATLGAWLALQIKTALGA